MAAKNVEVEGVLLWTRVTEAAIASDPSQYSTHDTRQVHLATTEPRVHKLLETISTDVLPNWYTELNSLRNITKANLDQVAKELSTMLKALDPEDVHRSVFAIQHLPTLADERPTTQKGGVSAAATVSQAWPTLPYLIKATSPAFKKDAQGVIVPGSFNACPVNIYVDNTVMDEFSGQLKPKVQKDEWNRLQDTFFDPDAWLDENTWGWRAIVRLGFKISKGVAGLKVGFYPNEISLHSKTHDYPASGPSIAGTGRNDDDL